MELNTIGDLLIEISYLKKKASLVDEILKHYDMDQMNFNIPDKWKDISRYSPEALKKIPKSPRHALNKKISELLPFSENELYVNLGNVYETAG